MMSLYGKGNGTLLVHDAALGVVADSTVDACSMSGYAFTNTQFIRTHVYNADAENTRFVSCHMDACSFLQTNMHGARFDKTAFSDTSFNGITFINSEWNGCRCSAGTIKQSSMQRMLIDRCVFSGCVFSDFEGVFAHAVNCVFVGCTIEITYGSGLNGFAQALLENTLFYNCRFNGFPLRGASLKNSIFIGCSGEIGDVMETDNTVGLRRGASSEELSAAVRHMDEGAVRNALIEVLSLPDAGMHPIPGQKREFANFAQAVEYMKNEYAFEELDAFTTEADLVYVQAGNRKVLLTEQEPLLSVREKTAEAKSDESEKKSGRFTQLEL